MTAEPLPPAGRADHARNRARILSAARELLRERPLEEVSIDDVAAAAEVSRATLFRHIGSKDALVAQIYRVRIADMHRLVLAALRYDDPWEGFEYFLRTMARWMHDDRGLYSYTRTSAMNTDGQTERLDLIAAMDRVLERCRDATVLRSFIQVDDLIPLLAFTATVESNRQDAFTDMLLHGLHT